MEFSVDFEQDLLQRTLRLDSEALAEMYDKYSPALYRYAMRLLGDPDLAEDCVAETFTRYLQAIRKRQGPREYLQAYLFRIAHNWITDHYRHTGVPNLSLEDGFPLVSEDDPAQSASDRLRQQHVRSVLRLLTLDQQQVIMLKYLEGWENEEIAGALGKPISSIKSLQHRALVALRRILLVDENEKV